MAQRLKRLPAMQETWVRSLGREDPLEKETDACLGKMLLLPEREKKPTTTGGRTWVTPAKDPGGGERISLRQTPLRNKGKSNLKLEEAFQTSPGEAANGTEPALVD